VGFNYVLFMKKQWINPFKLKPHLNVIKEFIFHYKNTTVNSKDQLVSPIQGNNLCLL
jgi:hypothetical protein